MFCRHFHIEWKLTRNGFICLFVGLICISETISAEIVSVNVIVSGDVHRPSTGKKAPAALHMNNSLPQKYPASAVHELKYEHDIPEP